MIGLAVAVAGGLGGGARYLLDTLLTPRLPARLPLATLLINVLGSFLLGLLVGTSAGPTSQLVLGTGFLGGFTTFSAASAECVRLAFARRIGAAAFFAALMLAASVAAAALGYLGGAVLTDGSALTG